MSDESARTSLAHTTEIVANYVSNHHVTAADLPALIRSTYETLQGLGSEQPAAPAVEDAKQTPAKIRKSITPEALISFIDGKPYKTLKRHLTTHGLTIADYKARFGLPRDYPTTAPAYSERRSAMAKALGLGSGGRKTNPAAKGKTAR